jgi:hypothetical protein
MHRSYSVAMRKRVALAGFLAFVVLAGIGVVAVVRLLGKVPLLVRSASCTVGASGAQQVELDPGQLANAATITAVGIRRGVPRQGIVIALATAWQESKLENLAGGDRDSIGLFQQRPSQGWGQAEEIADPRYASARFYNALVRVKGWQDMRVTDAAQAVQRSAHPEAYEKWADESLVMAASLGGETGGSVGCTVPEEPESRGVAAAEALVEGLRLDWGDKTAGTLEGVGVSVTVKTEQAGWQYAHWLVAHASDRGVKRVTFGGRQWDSGSGEWASGDGTATGAVVVAEVHS